MFKRHLKPVSQGAFGSGENACWQVGVMRDFYKSSAWVAKIIGDIQSSELAVGSDGHHEHARSLRKVNRTKASVRVLEVRCLQSLREMGLPTAQHLASLLEPSPTLRPNGFAPGRFQ